MSCDLLSYTTTSQGQTLKFKFSSPCRRVTMVVLWPDITRLLPSSIACSFN